MIDVKEHLYFDDPKTGHPDVRTYLKNVSYFFLGNGLIQAAVQYAPAAEGSVYGLLIMDPDKLKHKRGSYTMDLKKGIENTQLNIKNVLTEEKYNFDIINAEWDYNEGIPVALIKQKSEKIELQESFYCPDRSNARIIRKVGLKNNSLEDINLSLKTAIPGKTINKEINILADNLINVYIEYVLFSESIDVKFVSETEPQQDSINYWNKIADFYSGSGLIDNYFKMSSILLPSVLSEKGKVDASIWQYNREWVRDHSYMAVGLILSGSFKLAEVVLQRLLDDFISESGSPMDSSEEREYTEVELDQNGILISTIKLYYLWTGNIEFIRKNWQRISIVADFPMKQVFYHKNSGMLFNCRDFWERHKAHGIKPGIEFIHQALVSIGLKDASFLASILSFDDEAEKWKNFSENLKRNVLENEKYKMTDELGFIKRRNIDGSVLEKIIPLKNSGLPEEVPLAQNIEHKLRPDTATAIPVALGFVSPHSDLAKNTMKQMAILWNQDWNMGGHGRYHYSSEADSSGPWPFSSIIVARAGMETGNYQIVMKVLEWMNNIPGSLSGSWFEVYCNRISPPYAQIGITPWTWGEIIMLVVQHIAGVFPEENYIRIKPNLLPGMKVLKLKLPIRNVQLNIDIKCEKNISDFNYKSNTGIIEQNKNEVLIKYSKNDIFLEGIIPANS
ncbi:hypothetical protein ACFLSI_01890 [Bacteroidota bacterium]